MRTIILIALCLLNNLQLFSQSPIDCIPLVESAEYAKRHQSIEKAIQAYDNLLNKCNWYDSAYNSRGLLKRSVGDMYGAIDDFTKARELNDTIPEYLVNLILCFIDLERYNSVIEYGNELLKSTPPKYALSPSLLATLYTTIGDAYSELDDPENALLNYNKAISADPAFHFAYARRGKLKNVLGDYRGGIKDCNEALLIKPEFIDCYEILGVAKRNLGRLDEALADYNTAIALHPDIAVFYALRGLVKYDLEDTEGACSDFSKAGELGIFMAYEMIRDLCN